uniref:Aminoacyl tRNA synthase complex-interacting multifunctional protein 1 n=1 Tax=Aceria tosichella TaxID=561515 RepID=A0A6G1SEI2_9ACAR
MLVAPVRFSRRILLVSIRSRERLLIRRDFSLKTYFESILSTKFRSQETVNNHAMDTIQALQNEKKQLEERIQELVGQLESKKKPNEIKVKPEQVIRSKEEQEATAAMEQLELKEKSQKQASAGTATTTATSTTPAKKSEPKGNKKGAQSAAKEPEKPIDVSRLDLRVGRIVEVDKHPDADTLYLEKIDCGEPSGPRTVISGLVKHVPIDEMRNRLVVVLCNLKPAKMRGILSEAMVMCASTPDKVEILGVPDNAKPGDRIVFEKYPGEPDAQLNPKKKIWEQVSPDIKTNDDGVAMYKDCPFRVAGVDGSFKSSLKNVNIR